MVLPFLSLFALRERLITEKGFEPKSVKSEHRTSYIEVRIRFFTDNCSLVTDH